MRGFVRIRRATGEGEGLTVAHLERREYARRT